MKTAAHPVHEHGLRVYWEDTDAGGVVFYANYLKYFERARTEWLRGLGFSQEAMRQAAPRDAAMFVVSETRVRHHRPARLDDWLTITVELLRVGSASLMIAQRALRTGELLAEGEIRIGCVDPLTFRPRRIPGPVLQALPDRTASMIHATP